MSSAGDRCTVLLRHDGHIVTCGRNGPWRNIPHIWTHGVVYSQVAVGGFSGDLFTVALRSDGSAVACGANGYGQCSDFPDGVEAGASTYEQVSAGGSHVLLLRSDGKVVRCGANSCGQCDIPEITDTSVTYVRVAAGSGHSVLLRSDGEAVACGNNREGQCAIPRVAAKDLTYSQIATYTYHTVLLRSDGSAVACGANHHGQCEIPVLEQLPHAARYVQVSAGESHTVLLRSDGGVVTCGNNNSGQCDIPPAPDGLSYCQVAAGQDHTALILSDGRAVAYGCNSAGQCNIRGRTWMEFFRSSQEPTYAEDATLKPFLPRGIRVVQLYSETFGPSQLRLICVDLAGEELCRLTCDRSESIFSVEHQISQRISCSPQSFRTVMPNGQLLSSLSRSTCIGEACV